MEFNTKKSKNEILSTIFRFKKDIFDKTMTDEQLIELADKFAKYAVFVVALDNGIDVGYVAFYCNDKVKKSAFVSMIIVDSEFQGKGYGKKLIEKAVETARSSDMKSVKLEVNKENRYAIEFYDKLGFVILNQSETGYILEKSL